MKSFIKLGSNCFIRTFDFCLFWNPISAVLLVLTLILFLYIIKLGDSMKNKKGFTLVELLVVLIIIGIIVGLSYPALRQLRDKNVERKFTTYQDSLKSSAKLYADAYGDDIFGRKENGCICVCGALECISKAWNSISVKYRKLW